MATDKLFSICGTAVTPKGEMKVRFATDPMRVKVLAKCGDTDITLVELDEPMLKIDAVNYIKGLAEFASADQQAAIDDYIERNTPKAPKEKVAKEPKVKKEKVAKAVAAVAEDIPGEGSTLSESDEIDAASKVIDELEDQPF